MVNSKKCPKCENYTLHGVPRNYRIVMSDSYHERGTLWRCNSCQYLCATSDD